MHLQVCPILCNFSRWSNYGCSLWLTIVRHAGCIKVKLERKLGPRHSIGCASVFALLLHATYARRSQIMAGCMFNPGRMHAETSCYKYSQLLNVESIVASWRDGLSYALWDKVLQLLCRVSGSWRACWSYARWDKVLLALESSFNLCVTCSPLNLDDFYASQRRWASYSI